MAQTTVSEYRDAYVVGQILNPEEAVTETRIVEESTGLIPGNVAIQGTDDIEVARADAAFTQETFQGIVVYSDVGREKALTTGTVTYEDASEVTILKDGVIAVPITDTVTKNEIVFFTHTTGGASTLHTYRGDLDTDKAAEIPAYFLDSGVTGDIVRIRVRTGAGLGSRLS